MLSSLGLGQIASGLKSQRRLNELLRGSSADEGPEASEMKTLAIFVWVVRFWARCQECFRRICKSIGGLRTRDLEKN